MEMALCIPKWHTSSPHRWSIHYDTGNLWIIWVCSKLSSVALFLLSSFYPNLLFVPNLFSWICLHRKPMWHLLCSINILRWAPKSFTNKFIYFPSHSKHQSKALWYFIVMNPFPLVIIVSTYCHESSLKIPLESWLSNHFVHNDTQII